MSSGPTAASILRLIADRQDKSQRRRTIGEIHFIDPLFAAVMQIGIEKNLDALRMLVLLDPALFHWDNTKKIFGFTCCSLIVILSWTAFHLSIRDQPIRSGVRFFSAIVMLIAYAIMFIIHSNIYAFMMILIFVFGLYIAWDTVRITEERVENHEVGAMNFHQLQTLFWGALREHIKKHCGVSGKWLAILVGFFCAVLLFKVPKISEMIDHMYVELGAYFALLFVIIGYRVEVYRSHKRREKNYLAEDMKSQEEIDRRINSDIAAYLTSIGIRSGSGS